jgi:hypothetical protein
LRGAFAAAAFYGVGEAFSGMDVSMGTSGYYSKVLMHGITGGVMNVLSGGKFGHGFAAAGVTQAFAPAIGKIDKGSRFSAGRVAAAAIVGGTASSLSGGKFANGAITGAFSRLFNDEVHHQGQERVKTNAQTYNPAIEIANYATKDGHLTHSEANEIWRANNDSSFEVTVDASKLTVLQLDEFNDKGIALGRVSYTETGDWLVHGSVTLYRGNDGVVTILPGKYDFLPHTPVKSFMTVVRNIETYGGFYVASRAGFSVGTDYLINYSGTPNVTW